MRIMHITVAKDFAIKKIPGRIKTSKTLKWRYKRSSGGLSAEEIREIKEKYPKTWQFKINEIEKVFKNKK